MILCSCDSKPKNTGQPNCIGTRGRTIGFAMLDTFDADGNPNFILAGQLMTDVFMLSKINDTPDKRWNILTGFKNVDQPVADATTETFDGVDEKVEDGVETFTGVRTGGSGDPKFKAILDSRECRDTSVYEITVNGELVGELGADGNLYPIKIETGTMNTKYIKPTQGTKQKLQFDFAVSKVVYTGNYKYISADQFEKPLLSYRSLQDIVGTADNATTTSVEITLKGEFGPFNQDEPFTGLVPGDWSLFNQTSQSIVAVLTAVEVGVTGVYNLTFAAQTASDVMEYDFTKAGFELAEDPSTFTV